MPADPKTELTLILKRTIAAPREQVFDAWTIPDLMRQWFCPDDTFSVSIAEVDLTVGGAFRIGMKHPNDEVAVAKGVYREIKRPEKLVFTWTWEHDPIDTLITVTLNDLGNATELVLKHEYLPTIEKRDDHAKGWNGCLAQLEKYLQR
jgi:uncharacterized protein YndB with AHSA1/START domain